MQTSSKLADDRVQNAARFNYKIYGNAVYYFWEKLFQKSPGFTFIEYSIESKLFTEIAMSILKTLWQILFLVENLTHQPQLYLMMFNWTALIMVKQAICARYKDPNIFDFFFLEKSWGRPAPPLHHQTPARTLKQPARVTVTEKCLPQHNATGLSKY